MTLKNVCLRGWISEMPVVDELAIREGKVVNMKKEWLLARIRYQEAYKMAD